MPDETITIKLTPRCAAFLNAIKAHHDTARAETQKTIDEYEIRRSKAKKGDLDECLCAPEPLPDLSLLDLATKALEDGTAFTLFRATHPGHFPGSRIL